MSVFLPGGCCLVLCHRLHLCLLHNTRYMYRTHRRLPAKSLLLQVAHAVTLHRPPNHQLQTPKKAGTCNSTCGALGSLPHCAWYRFCMRNLESRPCIVFTGNEKLYSNKSICLSIWLCFLHTAELLSSST